MPSLCCILMCCILMTISLILSAQASTFCVTDPGSCAGKKHVFERREGKLNPFNGIEVPDESGENRINTVPAFADIDNDGDMDLVIGRQAGDLKFYYENTGSRLDPSYTRREGLLNPFDEVVDMGSYSWPAFVDIDDDGDLDLVIGREEGDLSFYYENTGNASNPTYMRRDGALNPFDGIDVGHRSAPAFVDVDNDGDMDLVVGRQEGDLRFYYENTGNASNPTYTRRESALNPFSRFEVATLSTAAFIDVDNDGDMDLLIGSWEGDLNFYCENTGNAVNPSYTRRKGLLNPFDGAAGVGSHCVPAFVDIDGDGDMDLVIGRRAGELNFYYENTANASKLSYTRRGVNPFDWINVGKHGVPVFVDIDDDDDMDLVIGRQEGDLNFYYENTGNASNPTYMRIDGALNPFDGIDVGNHSVPAFVDVDNDGDMDLVVGRLEGDLRFYYENIGNASRPTYLRREGALNPFGGIDVGTFSAPAFVDTDYDGDMDLIVGAYEPITYFENAGNASHPNYTRKEDSPFSDIPGFHFSKPTFVDADNDGDTDLVIGIYEGHLIQYYENTGSDRHTSYTKITGSQNPFDGINVGRWSAPAFVDLNNDGNKELVIGRWKGDLTFVYDLSFCASSCNNQGLCIYKSGVYACDCSLDRYSGSFCNRCAPGYSESKFETSSRNFQLPTPCITCDKGFWNNETGSVTCIECDAGYFQPSPRARSIADCKACHRGQSSSGFSASSRCNVCLPGEFSNTSGLPTCSECLENFFTESKNSTTCKICPAGWSTLGEVGSKNCNRCPAGSYGPLAGQSCQQCLKDSANSQRNSTSCEHCESNQFTEGPGRVFCQTCPAGWQITGELGSRVCEMCYAGKISIAAHNCTDCSQGSYSQNRTKCINCPRGTWSASLGASNASTCQKCSPGQYSSSIGAKSAWECTKCSAGKFSTIFGGSSSFACHTCAQGFFQALEGNTTCEECPSGYLNVKKGSSGCIAIPPGSYMNASNITFECEKGFKCKGKDSDREACPPGRYSTSRGAVNCFPCSPGKYTSTLASIKCKKCPTGWVQKYEGRDNCNLPPQGSIATPEGSASVVITKGWTADNCLGGICNMTRPCVSGTYEDGMRTCALCPAGWSSTEGNIACDVCPKGQFSASNGSTCIECPSGWFQDQNVKPNLACKACPIGYGAVLRNGLPVIGSAMCRDLNYISECSSEEYLNDTSQDPSQHTCAKCPQGAACGDTSAKWSNLASIFGWWRIPALERAGNSSWKSTVAFAECLYPPACLGAPNRALEGRYIVNGIDLAMSGNTSSMCATSLGFRNVSRVCHTCNSTSRRQGSNRCIKCPDAEQNWGLMALGVVVMLVILCFLVGSAIENAGKQKLSSPIQKILLNHLQVASLAQRFPLSWTPEVEHLFEFQSSVSTVGEALLNPDCVSPTLSAAQLFYIKQVGFALIPIVAIIAAFLVWYLYGLANNIPFFAKRQRDKPDFLTPKDKFVVTIGVTVYLVFPTLCTNAFRVFDCKTIAGKQYLSVDLEYPCYESDHLVAVLTLGASQLFVFVIGLPLLVLLFLRRNRRLPEGLNRHVVRARYGLFYSAYINKAYFWELVLTMRKIGIITLSVFGRSIGTQRQAQIALFILFVCILMEIAGRPYYVRTSRHRVLGRLEIASLLCLWGTMFLGTLIFASQEPGNENFVVILSFVVIIMNVIVMGWLVLCLLVECGMENKNSKCGKVVQQLPIIRRQTPYPTRAEGVTVEFPPSILAVAAAAMMANQGRQQKTSHEVSSISRSQCHPKRYSQYMTAEGVPYYVPEDGGDSVWHIPENARASPIVST